MASTTNEEEEPKPSSRTLRKRVAKKVDNDSTTTASSPKVEKRRGRPRKVKDSKQQDDNKASTPTRSPKRVKKEEEKKEESEEKATVASSTKKKKAKGKSKGVQKRQRSSDDEKDSASNTKKVKTESSSDQSSANETEITTKKKASVKGVKKEKRCSKDSSSGDDDDASTTSKGKKKETTKKKKKKSPDHQRLTERDTLQKLWNDDDDANDSSYTLKICSWNVAGLRAVLRNHPTAIPDLVKDHNIDILCLQETKLQEFHLDDPKLKIRSTVLQEEGYDSYWSCSVAKKGYSGTAVFVKRREGSKKTQEKKQQTLDNFFGAKSTKKKNGKDTEDVQTVGGSNDKLLSDKDFVANLIPTDVSYKMGVEAHDSEGRLVIVDFPLFTMINCYVPNSGQKLERLDYRTEQWDKDLLAFAESKRKNHPVLWLGDLNVAHTNLEVWNDGAKHLPKQAGVTPQERASFQAQLDSGYIDAFRKLHPDAKGCYSYWSQRAGNREPNKGLRLDYFICSPELFDVDQKVVARDSYVLHDVFGSDHCPVVLELQIKK